MDFKKYVRDVPDFPVPGVIFRDISPLLREPEVFAEIVHQLGNRFDLDQIDTFIGIESRGFILAAALANRFNKGFVPCRKAGKLPPPTIALSYRLEYGTATLEIAPGQGRAVVVDDVLATGGTLAAALSLAEQAGYQVTGGLVLVDLRFLNQFIYQGKVIPSLIQYE